jgi:hypothetical protein
VTLSTSANRWGSFCFCLFENRVSSSRGRYRRRLIKLIFAGRDRIIMIRRELPLTSNASPAEPVANFRRGFSFVLAPAAAGSVLELDGVVICRSVFVFFSFGRFCFCLFGSRHAAFCCMQAASALTPIAQMKPISSRPTAVMTFLWSLPAAINFIYRLCKRF